MLSLSFLRLNSIALCVYTTLCFLKPKFNRTFMCYIWQPCSDNISLDELSLEIRAENVHSQGHVLQKHEGDTSRSILLSEFAQAMELSVVIES